MSIHLLHPVLPVQDIYKTASTDLGIPLGTAVLGPFGNTYRWVKVKSTVGGAGLLLTQQLAAISAIANITGYGAGEDPYLTDNTAITVTGGELAGAALFVQGGTGEGQLGMVRSNPALTAAAPSANATGIRLTQPFGTALSTDSDVNVLKPWVLDLTAASDETVKVFGVSIQAMTDEYYGFVLTKGFGLVHVKAAASAEGVRLQSGGATDAGKALACDAWAANESGFARVLVAPASADMTALCYVNCEGQE